MFFVVLNPDKTPDKRFFFSMADAQQAIADLEPDILLQAHYQVHPIFSLDDLDRLKIKPQIEQVYVEKFDGEYVGQEPAEIIDLRRR